MIVVMATVAGLVAACSSGADKGVSGKSIFETPTPSIFDEPRTPTATPMGKTGPAGPASTTPAAPPEITAPAAKPSPPPAKPTPAPKPTPTPGPQFFTLNLQVTNTDLGEITIQPKTPDNRYENGTNVVLHASPKTGAQFNGWAGDAKESSNTLNLTMDANKNIRGEFVRIKLALNVSAGAGGAITLSPSGPTFDQGATVSARAVPNQGYMLKRWTGDASGTQNPVNITMDREKRIGAEFEKAQYVLSTKVEPAGFIDQSIEGSRFDGGTVVTLTARPPENHRFISWAGDASGTGPTVTITMDSNKSVTAKFARICLVTVFMLPANGGTITPSVPGLVDQYNGSWSGTFDGGTKMTLTANPNSGFEFQGWTGQITDPNQTITFDIFRDMSISAVFRAPGS